MVQRAKLFFSVAILAVLPISTSLRVHRVEAATRMSAVALLPQRRGSAAEGDPRPLLVCFGDSLTAGAGVDPDQAYPADLQRLLDHDGYAYKVVNEGVSGNTTKDGIDRLAEVLRLHAQVVVVEFGGNDGLRGLSTTQAQHNLDTMVRQLKAGGARVAMAGITLPAQYGGAYIQSFNAMFPTVATRYHVPLLPFILQDVYGVPGDIQDDGIHATAKGNLQVALNIEHLVEPLLHK
ncbi:MAG: arylesterase [Janthinobacterium lividum]